jgi:hypothetical protein
MTKPPFKLSDYTDEQIKSLKAALDEYMPKREAIQKLVTDFRDEVIKIGANWDDAVSVLLGKKSVGRKTAKKTTSTTPGAPRRTAAKKVPASQDKTGATPEPGTTYVLKDGTEWTKDPNGFGAPKKSFIAAVQAGDTWAAMSKRKAPAAKKVTATKKTASKKAAAKKKPARKSVD